MAETDLGTMAWTCPRCARHVPARVETCRCGAPRPPVPAPHVTGPARGPVSRPGVALAAAGLVAGAALTLALSGAMREDSPLGTERAVTPPERQTAPQNGLAPTAFPESSTRPDLTEVTAAAAAAAETGAPLPPAPEPPQPQAFEDVVSRVLPAVAFIEAGGSRGTGFFVKPDQVLTNAHVINGHSSVRLLVGNTPYTARVATVSAGADLALLHVVSPNPRQPFLPLGTTGSARVGQEVIAVGSALGVLPNTVTRGIVSAVRRAGAVTLLQTDAAINPGNSGGPLLNRDGEVIGVNSMAVAAREGQGVAFAVGIDHVVDLMHGKAIQTATTPLTALTTAMGGPGEGERARSAGEEAYATVVRWAAQQGDQLDTLWTRYADTCLQSPSRAQGRAWFAVLEAPGPEINLLSRQDCDGWLTAVRTSALRIQTEMRKAADDARRTGVYPGVMRDLRRRHRLEWSGWEG